MLNSASHPVLSLQLCRKKKKGKGKDMRANTLAGVWYPIDETNGVDQICVKSDANLPSYVKILGAHPLRRTGGAD
jgi:hypothetical protein